MPNYHPKIMDAATKLKWNPHDQWNVERIAKVIDQCVIELMAEKELKLVDILAEKFSEYIETSPHVRGGVLAIKGTRFPLSRVIAELGGGVSIHEIAIEYELDEDCLSGLVGSVADYLYQIEGDKS